MARFPRVADHGAGRPLVLLHGWSVDAALFAAQQELVGKGFRLIVPELPGHGPEPSGPLALTIADLSAALAAHLAEADLSGAVLVGWSMGATVALDHLARRGPARVAGLVMIDMSPKVANDAGWSLGLAGGATAADMARAAARMEAGWERFPARVAAALFAPGACAGRLAAAEAVIARRDGATMAGLWRALAAADHRATVARLAVPLLAVAGAESQLYRPEVARWLAGHAPRGAMLVVEGAGHAPHAERPGAVNAALAAFAARLPGV